MSAQHNYGGQCDECEGFCLASTPAAPDSSATGSAEPFAYVAGSFAYSPGLYDTFSAKQRAECTPAYRSTPPAASGRTDTERVARELCRWDQLDPDTVLDFRDNGVQKLEWHRHEARANAIIAALGAASGSAEAPPGILEALEFYADREHYHLDDGSMWDDCSGEPRNFLWHEESSDMIEDGTVARSALSAIGIKLTPTRYKEALAEVERLVKLDPAPATEDGASLKTLAAEVEEYEVARAALYAGAPPSQQAILKAVADKLDAAMRCPPGQVDALVAEALALIDGDMLPASVSAKDAARPLELPHPGSPTASAMMDSVLAEYQYPTNSKNAARAGYEAARRLLRTPAASKGAA